MMRSRKPILLVEAPAANMPGGECAGDDLEITDRIHSTTTLETLTYLKTQRQQRPCVVLLTVDKANDDRLATLRTIKQDEQLKTVPVVVIGPSGDSRMVEESFGLGAAGYMVRSPDRAGAAEMLRVLCRYWSLSELPK